MDDLELLDVVVARAEVKHEGSDPPGSTAASSGASSSACLSTEQQVPTPAKKRRRGGLLSLGDAQMVKASPSKSEGGEDNSMGLVECRASHGDGQEAPPCPGCGRHRWSRCFVNPQEEVSWAFGHRRGLWCRDCHTCWRTMYSHSHTLALFNKWLREEPNWREWEVTLVSYLSLLAESKEKITIDMVIARTKLLRFLSKLLGFSLEPSIVVPVAEAMRQLGGAAEVDRSRLVTMRSEVAGDSLGLLMPCDLSKLASRLERPAAEMPFLNARRFVSTQQEDELKLLESAFGVADAGARQQLAAKVEEKPRPQNKFRSRLNSLVVDFKGLVKHFESNLWVDLKESKFTTPLERMSTLAHAAAASGDQSLIDEATAWADGMSAAKAFLKAYREYKKTHFKQTRLMDISVSIKALRSFVTSVGFSVSSSLDLLFFKVTFFDEVGKQVALASALELVVKEGLPSALKKEQASVDSEAAAFSPEVWLRTIIFSALGDVLEAQDDALVETVAERVSTDLAGLVEMLQADASMPSGCDLLFQDVDSMALIFQAAMTQQPGSLTFRVEDLDKALQALEKQSRLSMLKKRLYALKSGKSVLSVANFYLQVSAKDAGADQKLAIAMRSITDARLPRMSLPTEGDVGHNATIEHFSLVIDGTISDILEESLTHVGEALRLWSPLRLEQQAHEVFSWARSLVSTLTFLDEASCMYLQAIFHKHGGDGSRRASASNEQYEDIFEGNGSCDVSGEGGQWLELAKGVAENMHDEVGLLRFATCFVNFLAQTCPKQVRDVEGFGDLAGTTQKRVLHNLGIRANLVDMCSYLAAVKDIPSAACEAVEEWKVAKATGQAQNSFFANAKMVQEIVAQLRGTEFNLGDFEVDVEIFVQLDEGDGLEKFVASAISTKNLVTSATSLTILARISELLRGGVQLTIDDLALSLNLDSFEKDVIPPCLDNSLSMAELVGVLVGAEHTPAIAKSAGKVFPPQRSRLARGPARHCWSWPKSSRRFAQRTCSLCRWGSSSSKAMSSGRLQASFGQPWRCGVPCPRWQWLWHSSPAKAALWMQTFSRSLDSSLRSSRPSASLRARPASQSP